MAGANHVGTSHQLAVPPAATHSGPTFMPGPKKKNEPPRRTLTVRLPVAVIERLRRVARDAAGVPCFATMAGIVEAGVVAECERIEGVLRKAYKNPSDSVEPLQRQLNSHFPLRRSPSALR